VVDKGSCEAKQLARKLDLTHRPNTALLYLTEKRKGSCQKHLCLCNLVHCKVTAISICHFHAGIPRAAFLLQTNTFDLIQTTGTPQPFFKQEFKNKKWKKILFNSAQAIKPDKDIYGISGSLF